MIPLRFWERQNALKALYGRCVEKVCQQYQITRMELDILLFLANNPRFDTAAEIVEIRYLAKSQVSASVKALEQQGLLRREYAEGNRKTVHLHLCEAAAGILRDGQAAQEQFVDCLYEGFSATEMEALKTFNDRVFRNAEKHLKEGRPC